MPTAKADDRNRSLVAIISGLVLISASLVLSTQQQYFSLPAAAATLALYIIGATVLTFPGLLVLRKGRTERFRAMPSIAICAVAIAVSALVGYFDLSTRVGLPLNRILGFVTPIVFAALVPTIAIVYVFRRQRRSSLFYAMACIILLASAVFSYSIVKAYWSGTDEVLFTYLASHLFFSGANPYAFNFSHYLSSYAVAPTYYANGTCECTYMYPAFGFIVFSFIPALGISNLHAFVLLTVILYMLIAGLLYVKVARRSAIGAVAIFLWLLLAFYSTPAGITKIVSTSFLLLLAYLLREKACLSGILLGLAVSMQQLAWLALPFLLMLVYMEYGRRHALKVLAPAVIVFALANIYFIVLSPGATLRALALPLTSRLEYTGLTIMQALARFYPVAEPAGTLMAVSVAAALLALMYKYPSRLINIGVSAPAIILLFTTRNVLSYAVAYAPLFIAANYSTVRPMRTDAKNARPAAYTLIMLAAVLAATAFYNHHAYLQGDRLTIAGVSGSRFGNGYVFSVVVHNNGHSPERVGLYYTSRNPNYNNRLVGPYFTAESMVPSVVVPAGGNGTMFGQIPYNVTDSTSIYIQVSSNSYDGSEVIHAPLGNALANG